MIELLAGIASGGGVAVLSGFVGNIMGYTRGAAQRNITALFATGQVDALWCMCNHALSFHKEGGGPCQSSRTKKDGLTPLHNQYGNEVNCQCMRFTGDPSRNPAPVTTRGELDLG